MPGNSQCGPFYNLILEVTSHYFCHILFIRSESLGPAHIHGEGITQAHEYQEAGVTGGLLGAAYLSFHNIAHSWFSFLPDSFSGPCRGSSYSTLPLKYGSSPVLLPWPIALSFFIFFLRDVIHPHDLSYHLYADDAQIFSADLSP